MALDLSSMLSDMLGAAKTTAAGQWPKIRSAVTFEFRTLAQRIIQIVDARAAGDIDDDDAKLFFQMGHNNCIAAIAMTTALIAVAVQKIVNAALDVVRTSVNSAIGFALI